MKHVIIPPVTAMVVTLADLIPTGHQAMHIAYESLAGDEATSPEGRHHGRNPDRRDMARLTKRMVYERALAHDLPWFEDLMAAVKADPFAWAPSIRTMVPKGTDTTSADKRPIDDPPEAKRLVALFVRAVLKPKLHARFTAGQMGSRPGRLCTRKGATALDHVAVAVLKAIRQGYPWCVLIDLRDAFGRVPEALALDEFGRMGLTADAAKFLWNLVRIFAVLDRAQPPITRDLMGIEQGNPLSASIMDLVLAPVLRRTEARHDVRSFSYLDDVYLVARTEQEASAAYTTFRRVAEGLGFENVRDLWVPGTGDKGKNSKIVDSGVAPIRVLKTYDVDVLGISATQEKVDEYRADLRMHGKQFNRMSMPDIRRALRCQSLSTRATQTRNPSLVHRKLPAPQRLSPTDNLPAPSEQVSMPTPSGQDTRIADPSETVPVEDAPAADDDLTSQNLMVRCSSAGRHPPVEEPDTSNKDRGTFNGEDDVPNRRSPASVGDHQAASDLQGDLPVGHGQVADNLDLGGVGLPGGCAPCSLLPREGGEGGASGDLHPGGGLRLRPMGDDGHQVRGHSVEPDDENCACSSQQSQAGCVSPLRGDSSNAEGPEQPRGGDRGGDDGSRPAPHFLLLGDPAVQAALAAGRGFRFGNNYKGAVLNLTGLGELAIDARILPGVINGLIRSVRVRCTATVIVDPAEPWTASPAILGNIGDAVYERLATDGQPDGRTKLTLLHLATRSKPVRQVTPVPPAGADAVLAVLRLNRADGTHELRVVENGVRRLREVTVTAPSGVAGAVAAVATWVAARPRRAVALPASGRLAAVTTMLVAGRCASPNIDFGDAVRALMAGRTWSLGGQGWVVGNVG